MGWSSERKEEYDLATRELPYAQQERMTKWTMNDIRWPMSIYITLMHVLAIVGATICTASVPCSSAQGACERPSWSSV